jgi:hypothetical protein
MLPHKPPTIIPPVPGSIYADACPAMAETARKQPKITLLAMTEYTYVSLFINLSA